MRRNENIIKYKDLLLTPLSVTLKKKKFKKKNIKKFKNREKD